MMRTTTNDEYGFYFHPGIGKVCAGKKERPEIGKSTCSKKLVRAVTTVMKQSVEWKIFDFSGMFIVVCLFEISFLVESGLIGNWVISKNRWKSRYFPL